MWNGTAISRAATQPHGVPSDTSERATLRVSCAGFSRLDGPEDGPSREVVVVGLDEPKLSYRDADGSECTVTLDRVRTQDLTTACPWRTFRSYRGQPFYSGIYWSATMRDHDAGRGELDPDDVGAGDGEHLVECGRGAHASLQGAFGCLAAPNPTKDDACASWFAVLPGPVSLAASQPGRLSPPPSPHKPEESRISVSLDMALNRFPWIGWQGLELPAVRPCGRLR
jgi:hypothetical protein